MKGYLYTLEMLIAVSMIFGSIIYVFNYPVDKPDTSLNTLQTNCFEALRYLDERGDLRKYASEGNETAIENDLGQILAKSIDFKARICSETCHISGMPANTTIIVTDYYISGYRQSFNATKVRLYAWRG